MYDAVYTETGSDAPFDAKLVFKLRNSPETVTLTGGEARAFNYWFKAVGEELNDRTSQR